MNNNKKVVNYVKLDHGRYMVKNSNALYQALFQFKRPEIDVKGDKQKVKARLRWRPIYYPAIVSFSEDRKHGGYVKDKLKDDIYMKAKHVSKIRFFFTKLFKG